MMRCRSKVLLLTIILAAKAVFSSFGEYGPGIHEEEIQAITAIEPEIVEQKAEQEIVQEPMFSGSFDVDKFVLPEGAGALVVVEGTEGTNCMVYAFERIAGADGSSRWEQLFETPGLMGLNGMSNSRVEGD